MSQREKLLGIAIGCLLGAFALFGLYSMVQSSFQSERDAIVRLKNDIETSRKRNTEAKQAESLVNEFRRRSLPSNPIVAQQQFVQWLQRVVDDVGLKNAATTAQGSRGARSSNKPYEEFTYVLAGEGNIKQVNQLLYQLYSVDTLHRVRTLDIRTIKGSELKVTMTIGALSMPDFDRARLQKLAGNKLSDEQLVAMTTKVPIGTQVPEKLLLSLPDYDDKIVNRNLFAPANQAPSLASLRRQNVEVGDVLTFEVEATDPDDDELEFMLGEDAPEDADITKAGRFRWRTDEVGEYEFTVYVRDRGFPYAEDSRVVRVNVTEKVERAAPAREEEPKFDESKLALLTAIVQGPRDPEPLMCMYLRSDDTFEYLGKGDEIEVGDWSGTVESVEPQKNSARIRNRRGEYILKLGQTLADAEFIAEKESVEKESVEKEVVAEEAAAEAEASL